MYDEETDAFVLSTSQPLAQGAQAMLSYGDKGNDELLQLFGFVEGPNPHDRFIAIGLTLNLSLSPTLSLSLTLSLTSHLVQHEVVDVPVTRVMRDRARAVG